MPRQDSKIMRKKQAQDHPFRARIQARFLMFTLGLVLVGVPNVHAKIPNDPFVQQWGFHDTGVYDAWNVSIGSRDTVVAIIDNGFDTFHPDLRANAWRNVNERPDNGIDDDKNGYIDDVYGWNFVQEDTDGDGVISEDETKGNNNPRPNVDDLQPEELQEGTFNHGTLVAGLIGAVGNNKRDGAGINWNVRLMNLRVVDREGRGSILSVREAIEYAVDNGADVINVSIVGNADSGFTEAIDYAYKKGVIVVAAAGNERVLLNASPQYPVCGDKNLSVQKVLGVSGIQRSRRLANFSNTGSECIDITAPSTEINSTVRYSPKNNLHLSFSSGWSGTSFAAPFVSGAAALIKSVQPLWTPDEIYTALLESTHKTPGQDEVTYANYFGNGLLRVDRAITYAREKGSPRAEKILLVNPQTGTIFEQKIGTDRVARYRRIGLINIDDVEQFIHNGEKKYALVQRRDGKTRLVKLFTEKWRLVDSWHVPSAGPLEIAVGDVRSDENPEIILAPQYRSDVIYDTYSLSGDRIGGHRHESLHNGVRLGIFKEQENGSQIATYFSDASGPQVHRFDKFDRSITEFDVGLYSEVGDMAIGDIDGDGYDEFVLSGGTVDGPKVAYYERFGNWTRRFMTFKKHNFTALDLEVIDFEGTGQGTVLVHSRFTDLPVKLWNHKSKLVDEWQIVDDASIGKTFMVTW